MIFDGIEIDLLFAKLGLKEVPDSMVIYIKTISFLIIVIYIFIIWSYDYYFFFLGSQR